MLSAYAVVKDRWAERRHPPLLLYRRYSLLPLELFPGGRDSIAPLAGND